MSFKSALDSELSVISSGHCWCEGVAWMPHSSKLIFSDVKRNCLYYYDESTQETVLVTDQSNFSNGNATLCNGNVVSCEHGRRCLSIRKSDDLATATVLIDRFDGKRLNSPNDVIERKSDGTIWFTDPPYGIISDDEGFKSESQIIGCYVYCYDPVTQVLTIATTDIQRPNGLVFSPDESILYVADMSIVDFPTCGNKHIKAFDVSGNKLSNGRFIYEVQNGIPDGMTVDRFGQIYSSSAEGILVINPTTGHLIGQIDVPEMVSNCTFNEDETRLYITASTSVYAIEINTQLISKLSTQSHKD
ncbi:SMP-30/gluconolactonase/LRE family protein [Vibrio sp. WJH972]